MLKSFKPQRKLVPNVDYVNVSHMVDTGSEFVPYYEYANITHTQLIRLDYEVLLAHLMQTGKPFKALYPIINEFSINNHLFRIHSHPVNTSTAFSAGLGIIKNKNRQLKCEYYLYDYFCEAWMSPSEQRYYATLKRELYMLLTFGVESNLVSELYQSDNFDRIAPLLSLDHDLGHKIEQALSK